MEGLHAFDDAEQRPGDPLASHQRLRIGVRFAAAIAVEDRIGGEEANETIQIAALRRANESARQLLLAPEARVEARPALADALAGASEDLAAVLLALAHDARDLIIRIVKGFMQHEDGALDR